MNSDEIRQLLLWFLEWIGENHDDDNCYCEDLYEDGVLDMPCTPCLRARIVRALADLEAHRKIMEALDQ